MVNKATIIFLTLCFFSFWAEAQNPKLWENTFSGITYTYSPTSPVTIDDNIEMSGQLTSTIVDYTVDSAGILSISRDVIFPQVHPKLKSTDAAWKIYRSYFRSVFSDDDILPKLYLGETQLILDTVQSIHIDGYLKFTYKLINGLSVTRSIFPSTDKAAYVEQFTLTNSSNGPINIKATKNSTSVSTLTIDNHRHSINSASDIREEIVIKAGESYEYFVSVHLDNLSVTGKEEWSKRQQFINAMKYAAVLQTPNKDINQLYEFSKIRGSESIFQSRLGLVHSPGGGRYYVGFWANDQAEYISPLFPFLGYDVGNQSAINCYNAFLNEINEEYENIRYSYEVEGIAPVPTLDRGDAAMIAYGASQFVLAYGNKAEAERLWPLIEWCLEYNKRMLNSEGVVKSESDEMEGRIETGGANLSTSSLYYGALIQAQYVATSLGKEKLAADYVNDALALRQNIESFFGREIEGKETYRYYEGHENLRHWICMPLVVGINERKEGTIDALFNSLWGENGVYVERNHPKASISKIFWDRGTLYALRGTFLSGATEQSLSKLIEYSEQRLLKDRVPYPVEAYPEGSMAHLSAESGLYCRILTEGLFGIQGTGFRSFKIKPQLPKDWNEMQLLNVSGFGGRFSIFVTREGDKTRVKVVDENTVLYDNLHPNVGMDFIEITRS